MKPYFLPVMILLSTGLMWIIYKLFFTSGSGMLMMTGFALWFGFIIAGAIWARRLRMAQRAENHNTVSPVKNDASQADSDDDFDF